MTLPFPCLFCLEDIARIKQRLHILEFAFKLSRRLELLKHKFVLFLPF